VWAWTSALVTSSSASNTARSITVASGMASCQYPHTSRTKARAAAGAVGVGASRSSSHRYEGRVNTASVASSHGGCSARSLSRPVGRPGH
jgi:hypothetical protein